MNEETINGFVFRGAPYLPRNKYESRKRTDNIVIHCSATPPHMDIGVKEIREWHLKRGFIDVGYHFIIRRDGTIERGRPAKTIGSGVAGYNHNSVHVCLVGGVTETDFNVAEENFTKEQWHTLAFIVANLQEHAFPGASVCGHRDFPGVTKACPSFDVKDWLTSTVNLRHALVVRDTITAEA